MSTSLGIYLGLPSPPPLTMHLQTKASNHKPLPSGIFRLPSPPPLLGYLSRLSPSCFSLFFPAQPISPQKLFSPMLLFSVTCFCLKCSTVYMSLLPRLLLLLLVSLCSCTCPVFQVLRHGLAVWIGCQFLVFWSFFWTHSTPPLYVFLLWPCCSLNFVK